MTAHSHAVTPFRAPACGGHSAGASRPADGGTPASIRMAATLNWFLIDLVARGLPLDTAEATLRDGIRTQARALRDAGVT